MDRVPVVSDMEVAFKPVGLAQNGCPSQQFCQWSKFMSKSIAGDSNTSVLEAAHRNSKNLAAAGCGLGKKEMLWSMYLLGLYHTTWWRNLKYCPEYQYIITNIFCELKFYFLWKNKAHES